MTPDQIAACIILTLCVLWVLREVYKDVGFAACAALSISGLSLVGLVWQLAAVYGGV